MQTVANPTPSRNPQAFYATLHGLSGVITTPADAVLFLDPESGAVVTITPADTPHLTVLGAVASSTAQYLKQHLDNVRRKGLLPRLKNNQSIC